MCVCPCMYMYMYKGVCVCRCACAIYVYNNDCRNTCGAEVLSIMDPVSACPFQSLAKLCRFCFDRNEALWSSLCQLQASSRLSSVILKKVPQVRSISSVNIAFSVVNYRSTTNSCDDMNHESLSNLIM